MSGKRKLLSRRDFLKIAATGLLAGCAPKPTMVEPSVEVIGRTTVVEVFQMDDGRHMYTITSAEKGHLLGPFSAKITLSGNETTVSVILNAPEINPEDPIRAGFTNPVKVSPVGFLYGVEHSFALNPSNEQAVVTSPGAFNFSEEPRSAIGIPAEDFENGLDYNWEVIYRGEEEYESIEIIF